MGRVTVLLIVVGVMGAGGWLRADQGATAAAGEKVFAAQKCSICHMVAGKGNKNGPLDGVGTKLSAADIRSWIVNAPEMAKKANSTKKPPMKSFTTLPAADVDALVAYLQTLTK